MQQDLFQTESQESMSSAEGIPASHSRQPGSEQARMMTVTSGRRLLDLYAKFVQDMSFVKMLLDTSAWDSTMCYLTWKVRVTPGRRLLFQLVPSTPSTAEIESGLLPTPRSGGATSNPHPNRLNDKNMNLEKALSMRMLPTPKTMDHMGQRSPEALLRQATTTRAGRSAPANLREAVNPEAVEIYRTKMLPTPTSSDANGTSPAPEIFAKNGRNPATNMLRDCATHVLSKKMLPTPAASDNRDRGHMGNKCIQRRVENGQQVELSMMIRDSSEVRLNPEFVREMMGFPEGWLDEKVEITEREEVELLSYPQAPPVIHKDEQVTDMGARLKALGNAVVPQIPEIIGRAIMDRESYMEGRKWA